MDLKDIREFSEELNAAVMLSRERGGDIQGIAVGCDRGTEIADALNYAADEIERMTAQRTSDAIEIATLRSMVPTLKDGDAKTVRKFAILSPEAKPPPDIAALLIENGRLRQDVMSLRKGIDAAREHIDADRIATAFAALGAL
jgi:hypothetical protein